MSAAWVPGVEGAEQRLRETRGPSPARLEQSRHEITRRRAALAEYRKKHQAEPDPGAEDGYLDALRAAVQDAREQHQFAESYQPDLAHEYRDLLRLAADAERDLTPPESYDDDGADARGTQTQALVEIGQTADLFRTPADELFATFEVDLRRRETHPISSAAFKRWLTLQHHSLHGKPPGPSQVSGAVQLLEAIAQYRGVRRDAHARVAGHSGNVYLDVGDDKWTAIEISPVGWELVDHPPVRFRRPRGYGRMPVPEYGGRLDLLRDHINVKSDDDWMLLAGWLVAAMYPTGPYPLLVIHGRRGSAKSTATRRLRTLIDPNEAPTRDAPREARDLAIAARHARVLAYDNLSALPDWLSDAFCRLATGGGFGTRQLFTDDQEILFYDRRPVVLNGIEALATRGDLLDRAIVIELPAITPDRRLSEAELDAAFQADLPAILDGLLQALACSLHREPTLDLQCPPRMADFARRAEAAAPALGWADEAFLTAYERNRRSAVDVELDASPLGPPLLAIAQADEPWTGSATELLAALSLHVHEDLRRDKTWPKTSKALHGHLKRLQPALEARGVHIDRNARVGKNRDRRIVITRALNVSATAPDVSANDLTCPPETQQPRRNGSQADTSDTSTPLSRPRNIEQGEEERGHVKGTGRDVSDVSHVSAHDRARPT